MMVRNGTGSRVIRTRGNPVGSGPVEYRSGINPGMVYGMGVDAAPNPRWTTPRDDRSGKPGTPVRGRMPADWWPK
jgi:hypothetical protein